MSADQPGGRRLKRLPPPSFSDSHQVAPSAVGDSDQVRYTARTPRIVAARRLHRRRDRDLTGRYLAEGPQAVRAALAPRVPLGADPAHETERGTVHELFGTDAALDRYPDLVADAVARGVPVSPITADALAALAQTVQPQGLIAVCQQFDKPLSAVLPHRPSLTVVLAGIRDPGNAGTVLRTADAAGAEAVVFAGDCVDPYNGKCVRASAGSLFHVDVVCDIDPVVAVTALRAADVRVLAATGYGDADLDDLADRGELRGRTAWLFGSEAHGLPDHLLGAADLRVRVPIHGRAESLNLAAAAAVCLYASARAQRQQSPRR